MISAYRGECIAWGPHHWSQAIIVAMELAILGMRLLEVLFFIGIVGSAVVVILSFVEDWKELFGKD